MAKLVKQRCNPRPGHVDKKLQNVRASPQSAENVPAMNRRLRKYIKWKVEKQRRKMLAKKPVTVVANPQSDDSSTRSISKKENKTLVPKSSSKKSCLKSLQKDVNKNMTTNEGNITGMENDDKKRRSSRKRVTFSDELPKNYRRSFVSSVDNMWAFIKRLQKHGLD